MQYPAAVGRLCRRRVPTRERSWSSSSNWDDNNNNNNNDDDDDDEAKATGASSQGRAGLLSEQSPMAGNREDGRLPEED